MMSEDVFIAGDKLALIIDGIEKAESAIISMAVVIRDMSDCLDDMTNHYAELINSGDAGNWNPEEEQEVMAARKMVSEAKAMLKGLPVND